MMLVFDKDFEIINFLGSTIHSRSVCSPLIYYLRLTLQSDEWIWGADASCSHNKSTSNHMLLSSYMYGLQCFPQKLIIMNTYF